MSQTLHWFYKTAATSRPWYLIQKVVPRIGVALIGVFMTIVCDSILIRQVVDVLIVPIFALERGITLSQAIAMDACLMVFSAIALSPVGRAIMVIQEYLETDEEVKKSTGFADSGHSMKDVYVRFVFILATIYIIRWFLV